MANISWSFNIQVNGGPTITASAAPRPVEATDRIEIAVSPGEDKKVVDIQPCDANAIQLLLIKSSNYGSEFSFKAGDGKKDSDAVTLDAPQIFTARSIGVFGVAPRQLKFTNASSDQTINVEIFVARHATPTS